MLRMLLSAAMLLLGLAPALAGECENPRNPERYLPPVEMRHEPSLPFKWMSAEALNYLLEGGSALRDDYDGRQMYGWYNPETGEHWICRGLTGEALRIIRMHEEAHGLYGWRH